MRSEQFYGGGQRIEYTTSGAKYLQPEPRVVWINNTSGTTITVRFPDARLFRTPGGPVYFLYVEAGSDPIKFADYDGFVYVATVSTNTVYSVLLANNTTRKGGWFVSNIGISTTYATSAIDPTTPDGSQYRRFAVAGGTAGAVTQAFYLYSPQARTWVTGPQANINGQYGGNRAADGVGFYLFDGGTGTGGTSRYNTSSSPGAWATDTTQTVSLPFAVSAWNQSTTGLRVLGNLSNTMSVNHLAATGGASASSTWTTLALGVSITAPYGLACVNYEHSYQATPNAILTGNASGGISPTFPQASFIVSSNSAFSAPATSAPQRSSPEYGGMNGGAEQTTIDLDAAVISGGQLATGVTSSQTVEFAEYWRTKTQMPVSKALHAAGSALPNGTLLRDDRYGRVFFAGGGVAAAQDSVFSYGNEAWLTETSMPLQTTNYAGGGGPFEHYPTS